MLDTLVLWPLLLHPLPPQPGPQARTLRAGAPRAPLGPNLCLPGPPPFDLRP